jgi:hypothetical protein
MSTSMAGLLLCGAALLLYDAVSFRRNLVGALHTRAAILAANSTAALAFENPDDARQVLAALATDPRTVAGALYDRRGRLFATYPAHPAPGAIPAAPLPGGERFESASLVVFEPVSEQGQPLGTIFLRSDLQALWARQRVYGLVVALATFGVSRLELAPARHHSSDSFSGGDGAAHLGGQGLLAARRDSRLGRDRRLHARFQRHAPRDPAT